MAVPAPAIPTGNAYTVHVAHAVEGPLADFAIAAAPRLRRWKVPVRMHAAGDSPGIAALRERLAHAGARASAFSPAPSNEIPGEGFWKTTVVVVEAHASGNFWAGEREEKKVGWDPLRIALCREGSPADLPSEVLAQPDLWCVASGSAPGNTRDAWMRAGARAVAVLGPEADRGVAWGSRGEAFGRSSGSHDAPPDADLGDFAARIVSELIHELLSENLFDKTLVRADRECLGMRPLHLGRACGTPFTPAAPWGSLGRKERHESVA